MLPNQPVLRLTADEMGDMPTFVSIEIKRNEGDLEEAVHQLMVAISVQIEKQEQLFEYGKRYNYFELEQDMGVHTNG